jgi:hypothetical protein
LAVTSWLVCRGPLHVHSRMKKFVRKSTSTWRRLSMNDTFVDTDVLARLITGDDSVKQVAKVHNRRINLRALAFTR